jgi:hypothetical protein
MTVSRGLRLPTCSRMMAERNSHQPPVFGLVAVGSPARCQLRLFGARVTVDFSYVPAPAGAPGVVIGRHHFRSQTG